MEFSDEDLDLMFPNATGRPYERQNRVRHSFKPILVRAGLPSIRFHDLRHTAATLLSLAEHPKVVQERLGHATIAVTMDIYSMSCHRCSAQPQPSWKDYSDQSRNVGGSRWLSNWLSTRRPRFLRDKQ